MSGRTWRIFLGIALLVAPAAAADRSSVDPSQDAVQIAARVDQLLSAAWAESGIVPADDSDDAEFLRRASLDLNGVIPRVSEVREFLADTGTDRRERCIDRLLTSPRYATHLATIWRGILLADGVEADQAENADRLEAWLRRQFVDNVRYDRLVADFLTTGGEEIGPALFYTSQQLMPEKLAASSARVFLGLQIECAQCHDHPYDRWKQEDFWGYAAFFARLDRYGDDRMDRRIQLVDRKVGEVRLPGSDSVVRPKFPGGAAPGEEQFGSRRSQLAVWVSSRENPYLAPAAVNRVWAQLFGRGLVEPVDDLGPHNPPSHPQLLDELSDYFVRSGFDLQTLYRTLANTQAYQRTSRSEAGQVPPPESFARMLVKPLTAEQLYASLARCLPSPTAAGNRSAGGAAGSRAFVDKMQTSRRSGVEYEGGVLQALTMINGSDLALAAAPQAGGLLTALQAPLFTDADRIETLWLATLSRPPAADERQAALAHLQSAASSELRQQALGDVLWALLNSPEFAMNH